MLEKNNRENRNVHKLVIIFEDCNYVNNLKLVCGRVLLDIVLCMINYSAVH